MADTITIPSPRVFLTASPAKSPSPPKPAPPKPKQPRKRNSGSAKAKASTEKPGDVTSNGVEKKKQSKSRNGTYYHVAFGPKFKDCSSCPMLTHQQ
jgi:hypothetical protein